MEWALAKMKCMSVEVTQESEVPAMALESLLVSGAFRSLGFRSVGISLLLLLKVQFLLLFFRKEYRNSRREWFQFFSGPRQVVSKSVSQPALFSVHNCVKNIGNLLPSFFIPNKQDSPQPKTGIIFPLSIFLFYHHRPALKHIKGEILHRHSKQIKQ